MNAARNSDPDQLPDPRNPAASIWDGPPIEAVTLCSYDTDQGTVVYDPDAERQFVETRNGWHVPARARWR